MSNLDGSDSNKPLVGDIRRSWRARLKIINKKKLVTGLVLFFIVGATIVGLFTYLGKEDVTQSPNPDDELSYRQYMINNKDYTATYADYLILGNEYLDREDYLNAEINFKKAQSMNPDDLDTLYSLALVSRLQKDQPKALQYYDELIDLYSKNDSALNNIERIKAEREAVKSGDFNLDSIKNSQDSPNDIPL